MRTAVLLLSLFVIAGCGTKSVSLPDGGHEAVGCDNQVPITLTVKVVDAMGNPVSGATVTAVNPTTGKSVTSTTNEEGITQAVNDQAVAPGTVRITAQKGSTTSDEGQATFTCGDCGCTPQPGTLQLQLGP